MSLPSVSFFFKPTALEAIRVTAMSDLSFITHDIEGKARTGESSDAGCFQMSSKDEATYRPLRPDDIGPSWWK